MPKNQGAIVKYEPLTGALTVKGFSNPDDAIALVVSITQYADSRARSEEKRRRVSNIEGLLPIAVLFITGVLLVIIAGLQAVPADNHSHTPRTTSEQVS